MYKIRMQQADAYGKNILETFCHTGLVYSLDLEWDSFPDSCISSACVVMNTFVKTRFIA